MFLFGPPNIEKLKANRDVMGLIKALAYKAKNSPRENIKIYVAAVNALGELGDSRAIEPLINEFRGVSSKLRNMLKDQPEYSLNEHEDFSEISKCRQRICDALAMVGEPSIDSLISMYIEYSDNNNLGVEVQKRHIAKALKEICTRIKDVTLHTRVVRAILSKPIRAYSDNTDIKSALGRTNRIIIEILGDFGIQLDDPILSAQAVKALIIIGSIPTGDSSDVKRLLIASGQKVVEPLIVDLQSQIGERAELIARVLGDIGDKRAIEPIIKSISNPKVSYRVAENLKKLGWKPDKSKAGAAYWACQEQWDKCIEIGSPAVEPLLQSLEYHPKYYIWALSNKKDNDRALSTVRALGKIGDGRAVVPLVTFLLEADRTDTDNEFTRQVKEALGEIGKPSLKTIDAIIKDRRSQISPLLVISQDYIINALMKVKKEIEEYLERKG